MYSSLIVLVIVALAPAGKFSALIADKTFWRISGFIGRPSLTLTDLAKASVKCHPWAASSFSNSRASDNVPRLAT